MNRNVIGAGPTLDLRLVGRQSPPAKTRIGEGLSVTSTVDSSQTTASELAARARDAFQRIWLATRRTTDVDGMRRSMVENMKFRLGIRPDEASSRDVYMSLAYSVRDLIVESLHDAAARINHTGSKQVCYLSMEFLIGRLLTSNILNLGIHDAVEQALAPLGVNLAQLADLEPEAGLGNGGLGRLAACFLDSLATMGYPATGYGILYEHGMFRQEIVNGRQVERLDNWLRSPSPWLIARPDHAVKVEFYGRVVDGTDSAGRFAPKWVETHAVIGVPKDIPVVGFGGRFVNMLRLWQATATSGLDLDLFNQGDYVGAVREKTNTESISKILYPNDSLEQGRELRLMQEYFFVACSIADVMRKFRERTTDLSKLPDQFAIQLNDTHPALAVIELMRVLVDVEHMDWDAAWRLVVDCVGYTNHTLLPEALEKWPASLMQKVLPRHLQIAREIDRRFLEAVRARFPGDGERASRLSLFESGYSEQVRMAHVAVVGSHAVNGVSALHTELLKQNLFADFHALWPKKLSNKTNGVTPRQWVLKANPPLGALLTERLGPGWITDLGCVSALRRSAGDPELQARLQAIKLANKTALAAFVKDSTAITLDPRMLFDVQVKRLHEYKRQLMNALGTLIRYRRLKSGTAGDMQPRAVIFAGKAAPGYYMAKLVLRFICRVADIINSDPQTRDRLAVVFLPNYGVSMAEKIIPAADLSEQISTAGCEASGTGNMKFAMNGALTIGTLDGANIEMRDAIGHEWFFDFGLTADEITARRAAGYDPRQVIAANPEIADAVEMMTDPSFHPDEPSLFRSLHHALVSGGDRWFVLADLPAWLETQDRIDALYRRPSEWHRWVVHNIAGMGPFSSDRTIHDYASEIWGLKSVLG